MSYYTLKASEVLTLQLDTDVFLFLAWQHCAAIWVNTDWTTSDSSARWHKSVTQHSAATSRPVGASPVCTHSEKSPVDCVMAQRFQRNREVQWLRSGRAACPVCESYWECASHWGCSPKISLIWATLESVKHFFSIFIIYFLPALSPNKRYLMKCNRMCDDVQYVTTHNKHQIFLFCKTLYKKQLRVNPLDTNHSLVLIAFLCHVILCLKLIQIFE